MKQSSILFFLAILLYSQSSAFASAPLPTTRPDRTMDPVFEGIWKGDLTIGDKIPGTCVNKPGQVKAVTLKLCVDTNPDDGFDEIVGEAIFKKRKPKLLQRDASFKKISKKNRFRASFATSGTDNPGGEVADSVFGYFQRNINNDNSRHGNIEMEIAGDGTPNANPGDLVVSLGNCISGVLVKTGSNPACTP